ncbi:Myb-like DNA-binding domain containing protein [Tritrichomonas foetus]|uniref:Myb-like DNA-binding domain containing protein n=1 Tax=Tritrichomonas foetus TaxID=1144522 RepID=A0A1J4L0V4_9EUKA|nr:Myb-like DNA-binding domain containing protein [Tritrichomonas foetus]|eukprot:OHT15509.1 Myb-like DNA-binding domain containing protein [Tritrichomonas foetus]
MASRKRKEETEISEDDIQPVNVNDPTIRKCWTCDAPLYHMPYIKCIKCPEMDQCIQCFSTAATCEGHGTDHQFVLMDYAPEPLTRADWTTEEDALLLFGIKMYGVGNWNEITKVILTKNPRECEQHYYETYIESDTAPLPPNEVLPKLNLAPPLPFDTTPRESKPSISHEQNLRMRGKEKSTTPAEWAGWMPKRHEFEIEYMNEAEELISDITFNEKTETNQSLQFKIKQMLSYNVHLRERHRRTELALEWNLLDNLIHDLGGKTPEEIQIEQQIMPMAQAIPKDDLMEFANALHEEKRAQEDMKTLINWREHGIMTMDEGYLFNKLQELLDQKHVTDQELHEWNEMITRAIKAPGFRASIEREILTDAENEFVNKINLAPLDFLKIKDFLIREFVHRDDKLDEEVINELLTEHDPNINKVFNFLKNNGIFMTLDDIRSEDETKRNVTKNNQIENVETNSLKKNKEESTSEEDYAF